LSKEGKNNEKVDLRSNDCKTIWISGGSQKRKQEKRRSEIIELALLINIRVPLRYGYYSLLPFSAGTLTGTGRWKVSAKIQQLLNTLKRPKRRPLPEFYEDDDIELEMAAKNKDPNAPKPEGSLMSPAIGEQLVVSHGDQWNGGVLCMQRACMSA
jgi:hypothetical protein